MTDVEDDGTLEDGSPRPVRITLYYADFRFMDSIFRLYMFIAATKEIIYKL